MPKVAGNRGERIEHKSPIPSGRVRNLQSRVVDRAIGVKDQIEIESPRRPARPFSGAGRAFELLQDIEQSQGLEPRVDPRGRVQKFASGPLTDRLGAKDRAQLKNI